MPNWTDEQKKAIYEKGSNILVAAAAGSGKTAVLVERIINKVVNEKVDIDKLLVVTFTNAAAAEMRERVLNVLYEKLEENPEDENMQRQITLLNVSNICTIDSFCLQIVRNYFYELDNLSPNFRIADVPEIELLKQEVLDEMFEKKYEDDDEDFNDLINTYTSYKDDTPLKDLVLNIYNFVSSNPFPKKWLNEKIEMFNLKDCLNLDFSNTPWGKIILEEVSDEVQDELIVLKNVENMLYLWPELEDYRKVITNDIESLENLKNNLNSWDNTYEIVQNLKFLTWPRKKLENDIKEEAKKVRDQVKEKNKKLKKLIISDSKEANEDIYSTYDTLIKLKNLILEFMDIFENKKREKNIVDFSDIEHFALSILLKEDEDGNLQKTDVAKRYQDKFEEIAIDEYQDSNLVQESILNAVSRGNNIFMVGDVKQSIYKFRQAMPDLFLEKYEKYENIVSKEISDEENTSKEICQNSENLKNGKMIQLFKNFRSRENVLEFTNLVFQDIMSKKMGEVEYTKLEYLNFGATDYKEINQNLTAEIDIINVPKQTDDFLEDTDSEENQEEDAEEGKKEENYERIEDIELEAKYIATKIRKLIDGKYKIYDRKTNEFVDIKYRDIVILLRSTKQKASIYEQELINMQIPVFSDSTEQYLDTIEIQTMMNLLKIIDNPLQDIPLVSVLRSNIGGFTDDDLVKIRLSDKNCSFYECMQKAKINVDKLLKGKIERFLNNIEKWQKEQEYLALDELIWKIYTDTNFYNFVSLMPNGNIRQANLRMLFEKASQYEQASFKGLYNFIQFMEKISVQNSDMAQAKIIGENDNVVRIMSIHKSKGLEFPVVFLANTNKRFNMQEIKNAPVLLHQNLGIGAKYIDYNLQVKYDTLSREAVKRQIELENMAEEMRVLYVALTRAKEKLFITGVVKNYEEKLEKLEKRVLLYEKQKEKINPLLVKFGKSYLDWLFLVILYEKDKKEVFNLNVIDKEECLKNIKKAEDAITQKENYNLEDIKNTKESEQKDLERIENILEYKYPYYEASKIKTKMSVTEIKELDNQNKSSIILENSKSNKNVQELLNVEEIKNPINYQNKIDVDKTEEKNVNNFIVPKFIEKENKNIISSARKGTVMHLCMQKLDNKIEYDLKKVKDLVENLVIQNIITQEEAKSINLFKILDFTNSLIGKELKKAKKIYKEKPFYINIESKEIFKEFKNVNENILVQGIIDLYYITENDELVLVDYKTDYVQEGKEKELVSKYLKQIEIYKDALENALARKVDRAYIYSVYLNKEILV